MLLIKFVLLATNSSLMQDLRCLCSSFAPDTNNWPILFEMYFTSCDLITNKTLLITFVIVKSGAPQLEIDIPI